MQFRVPQNVMMEDKIIGPLTALQFMIVVLGGGLAFALFNSKIIPPYNYVVGVFFGLVTVIVAMGKFNGLPIYSFFRYVIAYMATPKTRIWHKNGRDVALIRNDQSSEESRKTLHGLHASRKDISELARVLDTRGQTGVVPKNIDKHHS